MLPIPLAKVADERREGVIQSSDMQNPTESLMNRIVRFVPLALLMGFGAGAAGEDKAAECGVEDWRYMHVAVLQKLKIEGSITCEKGWIRIRAYDTHGDSPKFLGVAESVAEGYIFEAFVDDIAEKPESMEIKYSIEVR